MQAIPIPAEREEQSGHPVVVEECGEPLVPLSGRSPRIQVYPYYDRLGFRHALPECYVREGVAERLARIADKLPEGHRLVIWDGWRPYAVQQELYDRFRAQLLEQGWQDGEELRQEMSKYVALPSMDPERPSRHLTGGAVDLTIAGPDGWLDMGTAFDDFSSRAMTRYYENQEMLSEGEKRVQEHRRLLYHLMSSEGFVNYPEEWWHYDYGNQHWASYHQTKAKYKGIISLP